MANKKVSYDDLKNFQDDDDDEEEQRTPVKKTVPAKQNGASTTSKMVNYDDLKVEDSDDEDTRHTPAKRPSKQVKLDSSSEDQSEEDEKSPNKSPIKVNLNEDDDDDDEEDEEKKEPKPIPKYQPPKRNAKAAQKAKPEAASKKSDEDAAKPAKAAAKPKPASAPAKKPVEREEEDEEQDEEKSDGEDEDDDGKNNSSSSSGKNGEQKKTVEQLKAEKEKRFPPLSESDQKKYDKYIEECPKRPYQNAAALYKKEGEAKLFKHYPELKPTDPKKPLTFQDVVKKHSDKIDTKGIIKKFEKLNEAWKKQYEEWKNENPSWAERYEFDQLIHRTRKNSRSSAAARMPKTNGNMVVLPDDSPRIIQLIESNNKMADQFNKVADTNREILIELRNNNKKRKRVVNKD